MSDNEEEATPTFAELGVSDALCRCIESLGWTKPTEIQAKVLPHALAGKDVVGLAETGSGKTGAFSIPIIHFLLQSGSRLFALILTPTRELALQINEVVQALGASIGLSSLCLVGGIEMVDQAIALAKRPHIIIATPGRLLDHLRNTKGFNLRTLKFLVIDEADRMLSLDFEKEIQEILRVIPEDRRSYLFSATMTKKVNKLQKLSLKDPAMVEVSNKMQTPKVSDVLRLPASSTWADACLPRPSFTAVAHSTIRFRPCEVEGLLPDVDHQRLPGPEDHHVCRDVQQRDADVASSAELGLPLDQSAWTAVAAEAAGRLEQVPRRLAEHSRRHRRRSAWSRHPRRRHGHQLRRAHDGEGLRPPRRPHSPRWQGRPCHHFRDSV